MNHAFEITPELLNQIESKYPGTNLMELQNRDLNFYDYRKKNDFNQ